MKAGQTAITTKTLRPMGVPKGTTVVVDEVRETEVIDTKADPFGPTVWIKREYAIFRWNGYNIMAPVTSLKVVP